MNILITDGENRSSLAVTRSLGRKGHKIVVSGKHVSAIAASSRFCFRYCKVTDPSLNGNAYADDILEIVRRENIEVIFPMTEQSIYCLNRVRREIECYAILACAQADKMDAVSNKYRLFQLAEELKVEIPRTLYIKDNLDFLEKESSIPAFPVVVKPSFSKLEVGGRIVAGSVMFARTADELKRLYETKEVLGYPSLIQELISGEGTGLFTLFDRDRHLALFSHRRLLEKPPSGGVSVLSESVPFAPDMVEASHRLLAHVGWQGVAMVEFKRDIRDGKPKLMEINGRLWGSLQLAVSSGVDFPLLCLDYYLGRKPSSLFADYLVGQRLKWHLGMLDHVIIRLRQGDRKMNLPPGTPGIVRVLGELMGLTCNPTSYDVYDPCDRGPFFTELKTYLKSLAGMAQ